MPKLATLAKRKAVADGKDRYFTGRPCKRGHVAERYASSRDCVVCSLERSSLWDARNNLKRNEITKKWYRRNRAHVDERVREWYTSDPKRVEDRKRRHARWRISNPDKTQALSRNRRARVCLAEGHHTAEDVAEILKMQGGRCAYCRSVLKRHRRHVDHILPLVLGGSNDRRNLQVLCQPCNNKKHAKHPIQYAQSIGLLL